MRPKKNNTAKIFTFLWERNISPFTFVRLPIIGPKMASAWTARRFAALPEEQYQAMHTYAYEIFRQKGSGEFALGYLLAPGAYARRPLLNRMDALAKAFAGVSKNQMNAAGMDSSKEEISQKVHFIYGSHDWMDCDGGEKAKKILAKYGVDSEVSVVDNAGHNVFLDNPEAFNKEAVRLIDK